MTKKSQNRMMRDALKNVGKEFGNEEVYEIPDVMALKQRKNAELAAALTRQFWNANREEILAAAQGQKPA